MIVLRKNMKAIVLAVWVEAWELQLRRKVKLMERINNNNSIKKLIIETNQKHVISVENMMRTLMMNH
jgi:hypothetical protein